MDYKDLTLPIKILKVGHRITVMPQKMNNDILSNIKQSLKGELEGKCAHLWLCEDDSNLEQKFICYVHQIKHIVDISSGKIEIENRFAAPTFDVLFTATTLVPKIGDMILAKVDQINPISVCCVNGPIKIIIPVNRINQDKYHLTNDELQDLERNEAIKEDDYLMVKILAAKCYPNTTIIGMIGDIIDSPPKNKIEELKNRFIIKNILNQNLDNDEILLDETNYDDEDEGGIMIE